MTFKRFNSEIDSSGLIHLDNCINEWHCTLFYIMMVVVDSFKFEPVSIPMKRITFSMIEHNMFSHGQELKRT